MATRTRMATSATRMASGGPGDPNKKYVPLKSQSGTTNIQSMTSADNASGIFNEPGYDIDYSKSKKAQQGGKTIYQPYYVKKKASAGTATTTPPPAAKKPAPTPVKPEPKERTASRVQTIIDTNGKKTVKTVVYSKYDTKSGKWVDQDAPLVIDYRTNEKKYQGGKSVKF